MGPKPQSSTPLTYKNNGITVIGPANIKININDGFDTSKSCAVGIKGDVSAKMEAVLANVEASGIATVKGSATMIG